jgi:hypothetical protein
MGAYTHLIPLGLTDAEHEAALGELASIHDGLRETDADVVVEVESTPGGDRFTLSWDDRPLATA